MSRQLSLVFLLAFLSQGSFAVDDKALLPPEQVFQASATAASPNQIEIDWTITDGYSLYRKNMRFTANTPDIQLGDAIIPAGKIKHDELLGDIEHYRGQMHVTLPITNPKGQTSAELVIRYQGCADVGVCYPPQEKTLTVALPKPALIAANTSPIDGLVKGLSGLKSGLAQDELLPPDQAFQFFATVKDPNTLHVSWLPAQGYYLYREKFKLTVIGSDKVKLGNYELPHGQPEVDEAFGRVEILHEEVAVDVPLIRSDNSPQQLSIKANYQGCADRGVCYPPMDKTVALDLPQATTVALPGTNKVQATPLSEQDQITQSLKHDSLWVTLVSFLGFGLLLSLTPCVFPMIPILSGIIVGKGQQLNTTRAFLLSLSYVIASAAIYLYAFRRIGGVVWQQFAGRLPRTLDYCPVQRHFCAACRCPCSVFTTWNCRTLSAPNCIIPPKNTAMAQYRAQQLWALLSSLIVGPCVAAPLAGALIYIGQTGDVIVRRQRLICDGHGHGRTLAYHGGLCRETVAQGRDVAKRRQCRIRRYHAGCRGVDVVPHLAARNYHVTVGFVVDSARHLPERHRPPARTQFRLAQVMERHRHYYVGLWLAVAYRL